MSKSVMYRCLINTNKWKELRRWKLSRNPLCERCSEEGEMSARMFDPHNLRSRCHECHVRTHTETGRSGKAHAARKREEERRRFERLFLGTSSSAATEETERNKDERPPG